MSETLFGPIITGADVCDAVIETFKLWIPTYLAELERRTDRAPGTLPLPRSWTKVGPRLNQPIEAQQLPAVIVMTEGTPEEPTMHGDGTVDVTYSVRLAVLVASNDREASNTLAQLYGAAVMLIALQQPKAGDLAATMTWLGFADAEVSTAFAAGGWGTEHALTVRVRSVATADAGPVTPDLNPDDPGQVETVQIVVEAEA